MDTQRFQTDVAQLKQKYHVEGIDRFNGVLLHDFNYPDGWILQNRKRWRQTCRRLPRGPGHIAPLMIRLPPNWPRSQPYIYLPQDLRYTKGRVDHILPDDDAPPGFDLWCVENLGFHPTDPEARLQGFLKLVMASFSYPDKDEPLRYVYENR